ncbi:PREDICTED: progestin and adipoQ receptor family member 9-like, partial [Dipodomys ordii]|uniref:Progestin and adipoQ receptor family member 9-like n=1 Tax=Dipodomys ordii TaxID=10020 RepID=A0A1S3GWE2_DIPOR
PAPAPAALLRWDQVPEDFVERFILSGYRRPPSSARECLASVLRPTNETLNFWTHFIPLLLFLGRFGRLLLLGPDAAPEPLPFHHPGLLPFWCYASGVLITFAARCAAHALGSASRRMRAALFYLDYASISYYGFGSTVAYYYYMLPGMRLLDARALAPYVRQRLGWRVECARALAAYRALVLPVAFALAVGCTAACCQSRARPAAGAAGAAGARAHPAELRTLVFTLPLSLACPIALEGALFDLRARDPALFLRFHRRYLWLAVAAFFNVSKIPERLQPGLFDVVGHSHQLFHIFTFLSIYDQAHYVEDGLRRSLRRGPPPGGAPTFAGTVGAMLLLLLCLGLVVRGFLRQGAARARAERCGDQ